MANAPDIVVLSRDNYQSWTRFIKCTLQTEGLYTWVNKTEWPDFTDLKPLDTFKLNQSKQRAAGIIKTYVSPEIGLTIGHLDDPSEIWETLKLNLEIPGRALKSFHVNEFRNLRINIDEDIPTYIARFEEAYRRVVDSGEEIAEKHRCYQLIESLPENYDYLIRELDRLPEKDFKFQDVKNEILKECSRRDLRERLRNETLMSDRTTQMSGKISPTSHSRNKINPKCEVYGKYGQSDKNCRKQKSGNKRDQEVNLDSYVTELKCKSTDTCNVSPPCWEWTLDSASTSHVCQNKHFFTYLSEPPEGAVVRMGTTPHKVKGIGKVSFKLKEKDKVSIVNLHNVLYVPTIHKNLISMSKMDKAGLHATMDNGFKVFDRHWKYLYTATLKDNFYVLKAIKSYNEEAKPNVKNQCLELANKPSFPNQSKLKVSTCTKSLNQTCNIDSRSAHAIQDNVREVTKTQESNQNYNVTFASERNNIMLWHERLGHGNVNIIKKMFRENLVQNCGQLQGKEIPCEPCILAKNTRSTYPRLKNIRSKEMLELIHSDVWGPAPVTSRNGQRYILTFIDDYSRRAFCYPLRSKDEVFMKLKHFITFVERQTNRKVKVMRTDNGLEYCNKQIKDMLEKIGIKHERTTIYSPQMNGVAERYNRVLFEGMRTFMQVANLPPNLWVEAVMAVNYIRNRIFHTGIEAIPFQRWYGAKPSIRHLKRYGCIAYVHQPKEKRNKFQPRAKRGVFVGYGIGSCGYRIYFPKENKVVESKHVTFDEAQLNSSPERKIMHRTFVDFSNDDDEFFTGPNKSPTMEDDATVHQPSSSATPTEDERIIQQDESGSEEKREDEVSTSDDELDENIQKELEEAEATFYRFMKKRKKGRTKGKIDIYILSPTGSTLRSQQDLREYCKSHKIILNDTLANFSLANLYEGPIKLDKEPESELAAEALLAEIIVPQNPTQAKQLPEAQKWKEAMDQEIQTMLDRHVWTPVPKVDQKVIGTKWVYTVKENSEGKNCIFKARLVALGNNQREGLDYNDTFSPVVNFTLIRLFIAFFIRILNWVHCLLDVKCAYLYGDIDKEICIKQPEDYTIPGKEHCVLKLKKAIYGLHQAGRCWYNDLHSQLITNGFSEVQGLTCVYSYKSQAIVIVYVDDLPIFAKNDEVLKEVVQLIESIYEVKILGPISMLLGINFKIEEDEIVNVNCEHYIEKCLKKFDVPDFTNISLPSPPGYNPVPVAEDDEFPENLPYRNLLGCLQYITHRCRPDIAWPVAALSQFTESHNLLHYKALLRILMYLSSTKSLGLKLARSDPPIQLAVYVDASWASDTTDRKSWSGYIAFLNNIPVTWRVTKQNCVALSPMEAEIIAATEAVKDLKFLNMSLIEIEKSLDLDTVTIQRPILFCDNTAAISFTKHKADTIKNRYIDLKYKFIRDWYNDGLFDIKHVSSKENYADILTKSLVKDSFLRFREVFLW